MNMTTMDNTVATIAKVGADAVTAKDRTVVVEAAHLGTKVEVPYMFDGSGMPRLCDLAMKYAELMHELEHPARRKVYEMDDLASLVAWGRRFAVAESTAAFVQMPGLTRDASYGKVNLIIDELVPGQADGAHRRLRAEMRLALHPRLEAWMASSGVEMSADAFNDFAQRATDEFSDSSLLSAVANLEVEESSTWGRSFDPESGRIKLTAENSQRVTKVPSVFSFVVPVFDDDEAANGQSFSARLSVKIKGKKPVFTYEVVDFKPRLREAVRAIAAALREVTEHVYLGAS
jgi:hypothetical protein